MNNLQTFKYLDLGEIRTIKINNDPWFVAKDVCDILNIRNVTDTIKKLDTDERTRLNLGRQGNTNIINEYGLYNLILSSRKPEAKNFKRWITHTVIPAIRQTGGYIAGEEKMTDEQLIAKAFTVINRKLEQAQNKLKEQEPQVYFANIVNNTNGLILIRDLAKLISNTGYIIGEKKLFEYLRNNGYLISKYGADYNSPTQKSIQQGLLQLKEKSYIDYYGREQLNKTTYVTGKGQQYFVKKFKNINENNMLVCPFD